MTAAGRLGRLLALGFARECGCGRGVESAWLGRACRRCWAKALREGRHRGGACAVCGLPLSGGRCRDCAGHSPGFDRAVAAGLYQDAWKQKVLDCKFEKRWSSLRPLLRAMARRLDQDFPRGGWHRICPVPPSSAVDGEHLPTELAAGLARRQGCRLDRGLLRRRPGSRPQKGLDAARRRENAPLCFEAVQARLDGETILLVDDVMTTGATASACAALLKGLGAARVDVVALARNPQS